MKRDQYNLRKIIDIDKWQKLQDSLSIVTNMAIITVDYKGVPISEHSGCHEFCKCVRNDSKGAAYCQKCDSRGGLEAVRLNKPYMYLCHYGIVDIAIPIIVEDNYIGAIMAGQVKLEESDVEHDLEQILTSSSQQADIQLAHHYNLIPRLRYEKLTVIADMLYELCNYIVSEALNKHLITDLYEKEVQGKYVANHTLELSNYDLSNMKSVKDSLSRVITNQQLNEVTYNKKNISNTILYPAVDYIYAHKDENVSLRTAAELSHVSTSYFSRLFQKVMGINYSLYMTQLKVDWAKELLTTTDMTIGEISENLGFNESGYFIKIFKKQVGVTPYLYRKYHADGTNE